MTTTRNIYELIEQYEVIWFDAWGVLCEGRQAMSGASDLLHHLNTRGTPWFILTNDASTTIEGSARRFAQMNLPVSLHHVISSGGLLVDYFARSGLRGARCAVLGPEDSKACVQQAGGEIVSADGDFDVLLLMDEAGFSFLDGLNAALSSLFRVIDAGHMPHLIAPNPDIIFPTGPGAFGITAGGMAAFFEAALESRYGRRMEFVRLGKPWPAIFHAAAEKTPGKRALMVGDQLRTDIRGAIHAGVDSALLLGGVSVVALNQLCENERPTWLVSSLLR
jgi:HAD superfamily hydrolase (TIGR01450 family)